MAMLDAKKNKIAAFHRQLSYIKFISLILQLNLFITLFFFSTSSFSQNAQDIIVKYKKQVGAIKWEQDVLFELDVQKKMKAKYLFNANHGYYQHITHLDSSVKIKISNDSVTWNLQIKEKDTIYSEVFLFNETPAFLLADFLIHKNISDFQFIGEEKFKGENVYVIELLLAKNLLFTCYFNKSNYLLVAYESTNFRQDLFERKKINPIWVEFKDYRLVEGVWLPFQIDSIDVFQNKKRKNVSKFNKIQVLNTSTPHLFVIPKNLIEAKSKN